MHTLLRPASRGWSMAFHGDQARAPEPWHGSRTRRPGQWTQGAGQQSESSALNDVRHHTNPICRDAGAASRDSGNSVLLVIRASTAMRRTRMTPMPATTICTSV